MPTGFIKQQQIPALKCCCFHPALNEFVHSGHLGLPWFSLLRAEKPQQGQTSQLLPLLAPTSVKRQLPSLGPQDLWHSWAAHVTGSSREYLSKLQPRLWDSRDALIPFGKENGNVRRSYHWISYFPGHFPSLLYSPTSNFGGLFFSLVAHVLGTITSKADEQMNFNR